MEEEKSKVYPVKVGSSASFHNDVELNPDVSDSRAYSFHLDKDDIIKLNLDKFVYLFFGRIQYSDIYDKQHTTSFCYFADAWQINTDENPKKEDLGATDFEQCNNFNSGD